MDSHEFQKKTLPRTQIETLPVTPTITTPGNAKATIKAISRKTTPGTPITSSTSRYVKIFTPGIEMSSPLSNYFMSRVVK